jgi:hypothetical protein
MKKVKLEIELTTAQWSQLAAYIRWANDEGSYYGNKAQFETRHREICQELRAKSMGTELFMLDLK